MSVEGLIGVGVRFAIVIVRDMLSRMRLRGHVVRSPHKAPWNAVDCVRPVPHIQGERI